MLRALLSGQTVRRASPFSSSQYSKFQLALFTSRNKRVWRKGPTSHPQAGQGGSLPRSSKVAAGAESSDDEFGILEDERCVDTGAFQKRYLLHELVFACTDPLPLRPQVTFTILTHADWCALTAVARCVVALLLVAGTLEAGARVMKQVCWCLRVGRVHCFLSRRQVLLEPPAAGANAVEKEEALNGGQFLRLGCRPHLLGAWRARHRTRFGLATNSTQTQCRFSRVFCCRSSSLLTDRTCPAMSPWESTVQSELAFSETDRRLRVRLSVDPRGCQLFKVQQQRTEQLGRAKERRIRHRSRAVPAAFLVPRTFCPHCPHQARLLPGNFQTREDWLFLRGIAGTECDILSVQKLANNRVCSGGKQNSSDGRLSACPEPARFESDAGIVCLSQEPRFSPAFGFSPSHPENNPTIVLGNQRSLPAASWFRYKQKVQSHVRTSETLGK